LLPDDSSASGLSEKLRCEQMRQRGEAYLPI
jgi:hypothetical protein